MWPAPCRESPQRHIKLEWSFTPPTSFCFQCEHHIRNHNSRPCVGSNKQQRQQDKLATDVLTSYWELLEPCQQPPTSGSASKRPTCLKTQVSHCRSQRHSSTLTKQGNTARAQEKPAWLPLHPRARVLRGTDTGAKEGGLHLNSTTRQPSGLGEATWPCGALA